jgi:hypothetical protein
MMKMIDDVVVEGRRVLVRGASLEFIQSKTLPGLAALEI